MLGGVVYSSEHLCARLSRERTIVLPALLHDVEGAREARPLVLELRRDLRAVSRITGPTRIIDDDLGVAVLVLPDVSECRKSLTRLPEEFLEDKWLLTESDTSIRNEIHNEHEGVNHVTNPFGIDGEVKTNRFALVTIAIQVVATIEIDSHPQPIASLESDENCSK